jgi:transposase
MQKTKAGSGKHLYAQRHLAEYCFSKLKQLRRIATRYKKQPETMGQSSHSPQPSYGANNRPQNLRLP